MSYLVRPWEPGDRQQIAELMTRLWFRDPARNERYLAWRYDDNPYPEGVMAVAEHQGRVVAVRGAHGMHWRAGGAVLPMPCLGDTVVHKDHEGRGLVQRLTRLLLGVLEDRGVERVVNQSPGPVVEKISLRTGWRKVAEWTPASKVSRDSAAALDFRGFDVASAASPVERDGVSIASGRPDVDELAELVKRLGRGHVGHVRDQAYFSWRFDNPIGEYRWVQARADRLTGYLVLGSNAAQPWRIRVLDLQGTDGRIQSLLLDQALDWGGFREVRIWWNRFPRQVSKLLAARGFTGGIGETGRKSVLMVASTRRGARDFTAGGLDLLTPASWDPRMIHSDAT